MATQAEIEFTLGETWKIALVCNDASGKALDLTGGNVEMRVASRTGKLLDLAVGTGVVITDAVNGKAFITVTPAMQTTANLIAGIFDWEARAILADGEVSDQAYGKITLLGSLFVSFA